MYEETMKEYKFTIFTPCYNGGGKIGRVFKSVTSQTYHNFEWIIVNDGSTDNSKEEIEQLRKQYPEIDSKIIYLEQENQGKHMAWNRGVSLATGDLFLSADADDSFLPNTLEYFNEKINNLPDVSKGADLSSSRFSGVNVCVYDPVNNEIIGTPYPENGLVSDNIELQYRYHIQGEHWGILRTDLLRENLFPTGKGHYWPENRLWFTFAIRGYKVMCYNDYLRAYYYEPSSLTHNIRHRLNRAKVIIDLRQDFWLLKNCGRHIFSYSPKGYLGIYANILKHLVMYILCLIMRK